MVRGSARNHGKPNAEAPGVGGDALRRHARQLFRRAGTPLPELRPRRSVAGSRPELRYSCGRIVALGMAEGRRGNLGHGRQPLAGSEPVQFAFPRRRRPTRSMAADPWRVRASLDGHRFPNRGIDVSPDLCRGRQAVKERDQVSCTERPPRILANSRGINGQLPICLNAGTRKSQYPPAPRPAAPPPRSPDPPPPKK